MAQVPGQVSRRVTGHVARIVTVAVTATRTGKKPAVAMGLAPCHTLKGLLLVAF